MAAQRRWYAGKGATIRSLSVDDVFVLDANVALLIVSVSFTEGDDHRYAVPVMRVHRDLADVGEHTESVIAELDDALLVDAMSDQRGAAAVIGAATRRRTRATGATANSAASHDAPDSPASPRTRDITLLGVEQSNSSVIVGGRYIAKLVRRLEAGSEPRRRAPRAPSGSPASATSPVSSRTRSSRSRARASPPTS